MQTRVVLTYDIRPIYWGYVPFHSVELFTTDVFARWCSVKFQRHILKTSLSWICTSGFIDNEHASVRKNTGALKIELESVEEDKLQSECFTTELAGPGD